MRAVCLLVTSVLATALFGCNDPGTRNFEIQVSPQWPPWRGEPLKVPGTLVVSYEIPAQPAPGSLAIFRSGYRPKTTAEQLLVERRNLVRSLPTMEVLGGSVIEVGGQKATLLELRAAGTGSALAPSALGDPKALNNATLISTRRVWVTLPRQRDTLEVLFHCPEKDWTRLQTEWERTLKSLRV